MDCVVIDDVTQHNEASPVLVTDKSEQLSMIARAAIASSADACINDPQSWPHTDVAITYATQRLSPAQRGICRDFFGRDVTPQELVAVIESMLRFAIAVMAGVRTGADSYVQFERCATAADTANLAALRGILGPIQPFLSAAHHAREAIWDGVPFQVPPIQSGAISEPRWRELFPDSADWNAEEYFARAKDLYAPSAHASDADELIREQTQKHLRGIADAVNANGLQIADVFTGVAWRPETLAQSIVMSTGIYSTTLSVASDSLVARCAITGKVLRGPDICVNVLRGPRPVAIIASRSRVQPKEAQVCPFEQAIAFKRRAHPSAPSQKQKTRNHVDVIDITDGDGVSGSTAAASNNPANPDRRLNTTSSSSSTHRSHSRRHEDSLAPSRDPKPKPKRNAVDLKHDREVFDPDDIDGPQSSGEEGDSLHDDSADSRDPDANHYTSDDGFKVPDNYIEMESSDEDDLEAQIARHRKHKRLHKKKPKHHISLSSDSEDDEDDGGKKKSKPPIASSRAKRAPSASANRYRYDTAADYDEDEDVDYREGEGEGEEEEEDSDGCDAPAPKRRKVVDLDRCFLSLSDNYITPISPLVWAISAHVVNRATVQTPSDLRTKFVTVTSYNVASFVDALLKKTSSSWLDLANFVTAIAYSKPGSGDATELPWGVFGLKPRQPELGLVVGELMRRITECKGQAFERINDPQTNVWLRVNGGGERANTSIHTVAELVELLALNSPVDTLLRLIFT